MAGLPNIIGDIQTFNYNTPETTSGAFQQTTTVTNRSTTIGAGAGYQTINFNASRSSSIYGSSETVTPLSLSSIFVIKY